MVIARFRLASLLALALATTHCLPGDDRPEPARLLVTVAPGESLASGLRTDDGWTVTFDRALAVLGDVRLRDLDRDGDGEADVEGSCNDYAETYYEWLFDLRRMNQPEKVGLVFGLGQCSIEVRMRDPSDETRIGAGASARDLSTMAALASDAYATDHAVSLLLEGTARLDDDTPDLPRGTTKRFAWAFRRAYEFGACPATTGDGYATNLALVGGANLALVFEARVEELFRAAVRDDATTHFAPLALADVDLDGVVTLDELGLAPAPADALAGVDFSDETAPRSGADGEPITLADLVYDHLLPRVVRARGGGSCRSELRD